jgi:hypothetical protein
MGLAAALAARATALSPRRTFRANDDDETTTTTTTSTTTTTTRARRSHFDGDSSRARFFETRQQKTSVRDGV